MQLPIPPEPQVPPSAALQIFLCVLVVLLWFEIILLVMPER
jgi:hypothetical protein